MFIYKQSLKSFLQKCKIIIPNFIFQINPLMGVLESFIGLWHVLQKVFLKAWETLYRSRLKVAFKNIFVKYVTSCYFMVAEVKKQNNLVSKNATDKKNIHPCYHFFFFFFWVNLIEFFKIKFKLIVQREKVSIRTNKFASGKLL